jgi:glycosyltransferase involved in cell wall biosynthesis
MKNVLFIGPYIDTNGLGFSSRRYIDALIANKNINLTIQPTFITKSSIDNPITIDKYTQYRHNRYSYYDYVIQHGYPEIFVYDNRCGKNIGVVEIETRNIQRSGWVNKINLMDEVYVNSINGLNTLYDSNVIKPIKLVPEPYNIESFSKHIDPFFTDLPNNDKPFIFYTIGAYSEKKNIKGIILAYLLEFNKNDNVKLFIKTHSYHQKLQDLDSRINFDIQQLKNSIRKNNYADINIVSGYISDEDIIRLHNSSDCYINAARADGMGPCAVESMLCDKMIINTKNIGSSTYFNSSNALMIDSIETNVYSPEYINPNIFTINELWNEPNISHLQSQMRNAYAYNQNQRDDLIKNYRKDLFTQQNFNETLP